MTSYSTSNPYMSSAGAVNPNAYTSSMMSMSPTNVSQLNSQMSQMQMNPNVYASSAPVPSALASSFASASVSPFKTVSANPMLQSQTSLGIGSQQATSTLSSYGSQSPRTTAAVTSNLPAGFSAPPPPGVTSTPTQGRPFGSCLVVSCNLTSSKPGQIGCCGAHQLLIDSTPSKLGLAIQLKIRWETDDINAQSALCWLQLPLDSDLTPIVSELNKLPALKGISWKILYKGNEVEKEQYSIFTARFFLPSMALRQTGYSGQVKPPPAKEYTPAPSTIAGFNPNGMSQQQQPGMGMMGNQNQMMMGMNPMMMPMGMNPMMMNGMGMGGMGMGTPMGGQGMGQGGSPRGPAPALPPRSQANGVPPGGQVFSPAPSSPSPSSPSPTPSSPLSSSPPPSSSYSPLSSSPSPAMFTSGGAGMSERERMKAMAKPSRAVKE